MSKDMFITILSMVYIITVIIGVFIFQISFVPESQLVEMSELTTKFEEAAIFLSGEMTGPATVITTFGALQMFEFAHHDRNGYIYSMYAPYTLKDWEKALAGDYSYRKSEALWKSYGIDYEKPKYAVIHEKHLTSSVLEYDMSYFWVNRRFELLKMFEGDAPNDRTFIFKIVEVN